MRYMLVNRIRPDLSKQEYARLGGLAQDFYDHVPDGIRLLGDWAAADGSRNFALLEAQDPELLAKVQEPFRGLVDIDIVPVVEVDGWGKRGGAV